MYQDKKKEILKLDCYTYHKYDLYEECYNITWIRASDLEKNEEKNPVMITTETTPIISETTPTISETTQRIETRSDLINGTKIICEQILVNGTIIKISNETTMIKNDDYLEIMNIINETRIKNLNVKNQTMVITNTTIIIDIKRIYPNKMKPKRSRMTETTITVEKNF